MTHSKREMRVGVDEAPPAPFCFGLPGTSDFRGFEVDLLGELAVRLGVTLRFTSALWSRILGDLEAGRLDLICTAATITADRRRVVDFSDPYFEGDLALVTREDSPLTAPDAALDGTIGVRVATVAENIVRTRLPGARVQTFDLNVEQYRALRDGRVDAVADDRPIAAFFVRSTSGLRLGPSIPDTGYQYGIVFAKGANSLRMAVNRHLADMRADGTLARLRERWLEDVDALGRTGWARFEWTLHDLPSETPLPDPFSFRLADRDEAAVLLDVVIEAYASDPCWLPTMEEVKSRVKERIVSTIGQEGCEYLTVVHRGHVVAVSGIAAAHWTGQNLLTGICVLPAHQRRGIGRRLLLESLFRLRAMGLETATVYTESGSVADRRLYPLFGASREAGVQYPGASSPSVQTGMG